MSQLTVTVREREFARRGENPVAERILTLNDKTTLSWDTPLWTCRPTGWCYRNCYACVGRMCMDPAIRRRVWAYRYCLDHPELAVGRVIAEMQRAGVTELRLYGAGEFANEQIPFLRCLADALKVRGWMAYGFTKKPHAFRILNSMTLGFKVWFSVDRTMDVARKRFATRVGLDNCAYCSTPEDTDVDLEAFGIVFPSHKHKRRVPECSRDCPALRHHAKCGVDCKRCMTK